MGFSPFELQTVVELWILVLPFFFLLIPKAPLLPRCSASPGAKAVVIQSQWGRVASVGFTGTIRLPGTGKTVLLLGAAGSTPTDRKANAHTFPPCWQLLAEWSPQALWAIMLFWIAHVFAVTVDKYIMKGIQLKVSSVGTRRMAVIFSLSSRQTGRCPSSQCLSDAGEPLMREPLALAL